MADGHDVTHISDQIAPLHRPRANENQKENESAELQNAMRIRAIAQWQRLRSMMTTTKMKKMMMMMMTMMTTERAWALGLQTAPECSSRSDPPTAKSHAKPFHSALMQR
jgi:hypothetical protein